MLKFALLTLLAYVLIRAVVNLTRAMSQNVEPPGGPFSNGQGGPARFGREQQQRQNRARRERDERATRLRDDDSDVEDARWEDI